MLTHVQFGVYQDVLSRSFPAGCSEPMLVPEVILSHMQESTFPFVEINWVSLHISSASEWQHDPLVYQPLLLELHHLKTH